MALELITPGLVREAFIFADAAHAAVGQFRKYDGRPYIVHPVAVAGIVATVPHNESMLAAALLHDVVEDTKISIEQIEARFGKEVAGMVGWLTDVSKPEDGNRAVRKALDLAHTAGAPAEVKTIKLADLIHNGISILQHDRGFARVYLRELSALLEVLKEGDAALYARAERIVEDGLSQLRTQTSRVQP